MTMGDRIKERRKAMHLTQEEFGQKFGVQKSAVAKWENGRVENIKRSTIQQMAEILDCSPSYLLGFEEAPELDDLEQKILEVYRTLPDSKKLALYEFVKSLTE